jgi:hypothetical protein
MIAVKEQEKEEKGEKSEERERGRKKGSKTGDGVLRFDKGWLGLGISCDEI